MIDVLANSLVPVFVGLLLGYAAGLRKAVDNKDVKSLVAFLMNFALPCSLFVTIALSTASVVVGSSQGGRGPCNCVCGCFYFDLLCRTNPR